MRKVVCVSSAQHVRRPFTRLQQRAIAQGEDPATDCRKKGHINIIPTKSPQQGRIFPLSGDPYFTHIFSCSDILKNRIVIGASCWLKSLNFIAEPTFCIHISTFSSLIQKDIWILHRITAVAVRTHPFLNVRQKAKKRPHQSCAITKGFYNHLPDTRVTAIFSCEGKTWDVTYNGGQDFKYFGCGRNNFIIDNDIHKGDGGVFELIDNKNLHFRVQILRVDVHFHAKDGDDGGSTDSPILID